MKPQQLSGMMKQQHLVVPIQRPRHRQQPMLQQPNLQLRRQPNQMTISMVFTMAVAKLGVSKVVNSWYIARIKNDMHIDRIGGSMNVSMVILIMVIWERVSFDFQLLLMTHKWVIIYEP